MLSEVAKQKIEDAIAAVDAEGYTFCGFAVNREQTEIQPFSNQTVVPEYIHNLIMGAEMVADGVYDVAAIRSAREEFLKQAQNTKLNEA